MKPRRRKPVKIIKTILLITVLFFNCSMMPSYARMNSSTEINADELLSLSSQEALEVLLYNGLDLPADFAAHPDLAESFVDNYLSRIIDGSLDTASPVFNYPQSNELLKNIKSTLVEMGILQVSSSIPSRYSLVDSTPLGTWINDYAYYNCYAYSIGHISQGFIVPGDIYTSGGGNNPFSMTMSVDQMASLVLQDLNYMNYWGYTLSYKPATLPDQYFRIIALRKNTNNVDFHFMKMHANSLNSWAHKPSWTQPLLWNYTSPGYKNWTNEAVYSNYTYEPTTTYNSQLVYILYKSYSDPGYQYQDLFHVDEE